MNQTVYRLNSKGKPIQWTIKVTDNTIETWDGQVDGKLKYTKDVVSEGKNVGRSNETTPAEQALLMAERKLEMKLRKGYQKTIPTDEVELNDEFFNNPPRNFVGPKPKSSIDQELRKVLEKELRLFISRKWNGMCVHIVIGADSEPRIFTSNMDEKTNCFPWQVEELKSLNIEPKTWFMAEAVLDDNPDRMKTIFGALTERALDEQKEVVNRVKFKVFNVLYYKGKSEQGNNYQDRLEEIIYQIFGLSDEEEKSLGNNNPSQYFDGITSAASTYDEALEVLKQNPSWEGMVLWDFDCIDIPIKWGGSPSRNGGAWKLKNFKECDCLIIKTETGRGKLNDDIATLTYGAYDAQGNIVPLGRGGSGLDGKMRAEIASMTLPIVAEVKYEEVTSGGKFRLPVILRVRTDKKPEECLLEEIVNQ